MASANADSNAVVVESDSLDSPESGASGVGVAAVCSGLAISFGGFLGETVAESELINETARGVSEASSIGGKADAPVEV
jgi:hypothetical protein